MSFITEQSQSELYNLLDKFFDDWFVHIKNMYALYAENDNDYEMVNESLEVMKTMKGQRSRNRDIITQHKQLFMKWYWTMKEPSWSMSLEFQQHFDFIHAKFDIYLRRLPKENVWHKYWKQTDIEELNELRMLLSLYIKEVVRERAVAAPIPTQNEMDMLKEELERTKLELAETKKELQRTKEELEKMSKSYLDSLEWVDASRSRTRMEFDAIQDEYYLDLQQKCVDITSLLNKLKEST
jgi:hypothetical protein